jgi:hypothetical protein
VEILQSVEARGRRWRVTDVRAFESCELVTLETIEAASGTGEPLTRRLLTPFDEVVPVPQATGRGASGANCGAGRAAP